MDPRRGGFNHLVAPTAVDELFAMDSLLFPSVKTEPFHHHHAIKPSTMMTMMDMDVEMELNAALSLDMPDDHNDSDDDVRSTASHSSSDMHSTTSKMTTPSSISSPTPSTASSSSSSVRHRVSSNKSAMYPPEVLAHMPLPPRAEHVDQRERNRLIVKRCYYKKISTLNELRSELERVENNYQVLLKQKHAESVRPSTADELSKQQSHTAKLHQAYVELTLVSDALRKENEELRRVEAEYAKMEKQMAQLKLAQQKNVDQQRELQEQKRRNPIVELKPLTSAECRDVAMEMAAKIMAFRDSKNIFTTGASIFGWRDRHRVKNDKLEFLLEKQFQTPPADHLADMVWKLLSQADTLAKTYSPHLDVMYHEVQRVDSENVVFYHTLERPDSDYRIKALMLASRVYLGPEGGWLIVFKGLDPKKFLVREGEPPRPRDRRGRNKIEPQKEDIWIDTFVWGLFRTAPDGGSISDFGGIVDGTALISASWWMIHMLQFAQRCEASVVGPQFFLAM